MNIILLLYLIIVLITLVLLIINCFNKDKFIDNNMNNLITYVIHYTPLKERKQFLLNEFNKHSLIYHFIEDYDREKLSDEDLKIFDKKFPKSLCGITLSHINAYKKILNDEYKYSLILEDDVILDDKFRDKLNKGLEQLPDNYDMLFIGNCNNLHIPLIKRRPYKFIYKKCREPTNWGGDGGTRCTDSYLVSKKGAKKLMSYISKLKERTINMPIDWWLNKVIRDLKLEIYWMEPTIVTQGTETGKYKSSH